MTEELEISGEKKTLLFFNSHSSFLHNFQDAIISYKETGIGLTTQEKHQQKQITGNPDTRISKKKILNICLNRKDGKTK